MKYSKVLLFNSYARIFISHLRKFKGSCWKQTLWLVNWISRANVLSQKHPREWKIVCLLPVLTLNWNSVKVYLGCMLCFKPSCTIKSKFLAKQEGFAVANLERATKYASTKQTKQEMNYGHYCFRNLQWPWITKDWVWGPIQKQNGGRSLLSIYHERLASCLELSEDYVNELAWYLGFFKPCCWVWKCSIFSVGKFIHTENPAGIK